MGDAIDAIKGGNVGSMSEMYEKVMQYADDPRAVSLALLLVAVLAGGLAMINEYEKNAEHYIPEKYRTGTALRILTNEAERKGSPWLEYYQTTEKSLNLPYMDNDVKHDRAGRSTLAEYHGLDKSPENEWFMLEFYLARTFNHAVPVDLPFLVPLLRYGIIRPGWAQNYKINVVVHQKEYHRRRNHRGVYPLYMHPELYKRLDVCRKQNLDENKAHVRGFEAMQMATALIQLRMHLAYLFTNLSRLRELISNGVDFSGDLHLGAQDDIDDATEIIFQITGSRAYKDFDKKRIEYDIKFINKFLGEINDLVGNDANYYYHNPSLIKPKEKGLLGNPDSLGNNELAFKYIITRALRFLHHYKKPVGYTRYLRRQHTRDLYVDLNDLWLKYNLMPFAEIRQIAFDAETKMKDMTRQKVSEEVYKTSLAADVASIVGEYVIGGSAGVGCWVMIIIVLFLLWIYYQTCIKIDEIDDTIV